MKKRLVVKLAYTALTVLGSTISCLCLAASLSGQILDLNGNPVTGAMITIAPDYPGPTAYTVYSDAEGDFRFPEQSKLKPDSQLEVSIRSLSHELLNSHLHVIDNNTMQLTVIAQAISNQVDVVPASAWLSTRVDHESSATFVMDCIGCHQVPVKEFRDYAAAFNAIPGEDRETIARDSWWAMVKFMNFQSAEEFGRGPNAAPPDAHSAYEVGDGERVVNFLTDNFSDSMTDISGYDWGAPLAVTPDTVIKEYEIARPNAVREALLLNDHLWIADVASNSIFKVNPESGYTSVLEVPSETDSGPHSLHRGPDGSLWVAPFVSSVVAQLDMETEEWDTWSMQTTDGRATGIHDLSFGADHVIRYDRQGNIWFSDIGNNSVGYLNPDDGEINIYRAPGVPGRTGATSLYGIVTDSSGDRVWYTQLGLGVVGSFNTQTREFETQVVLPHNAGPRRLAISDDDMLFVPLYGAGQLMQYDTRTNTTVGIYDLPDTSSAPYAVTWDQGRQVAWVANTNADALYRFDPSDQSFTVLPVPRTHALIRMVDVDPETGNLITSYANIVEQIQGPRMALIIDPGDGAYQ